MYGYIILWRVLWKTKLVIMKNRYRLFRSHGDDFSDVIKLVRRLWDNMFSVPGVLAPFSTFFVSSSKSVFIVGKCKQSWRPTNLLALEFKYSIGGSKLTSEQTWGVSWMASTGKLDTGSFQAEWTVLIGHWIRPRSWSFRVCSVFIRGIVLIASKCTDPEFRGDR